MTATVARIERELEVHLREMELQFGGKVGEREHGALS